MPSYRPSRPVLGALAVLGLLAVIALALPANRSAPPSAAATTAPPADAGVLVTGVGSASGTPDVLRFTVGVEVSADTVDTALTRANQAAERLLATLREEGVAEDDLQTAGVQVHPRYGERGEQITGYTVGQTVAVTVRDLSQAGEIMSAAVRAGGDAARLYGVSFDLADPEALLAQARERAFAAARRKAEQYAEIVGRDLGTVLSVRETQGQPASPVPFAGDVTGAARAESSVPIEPGSAEVNVAVDVRWALA